MLRLIGGVCMICLSATVAANAQTLHGTVRDSTSGLPIPGVVAVLLDSSGRAVQRSITNDRGEFRVASVGEIRRIRLLRIGFRPLDALAPISTSGTTLLQMSMVPLPVLLQPVRVTAAANCPSRRDAAEAFALLEQARAGLLATVVSREASPAALTRLGFQRRMDALSSRIVRQVVRAESAAQSAVSFDAVRRAEDFARSGFVGESLGLTRFLAPDADVLLDEAFARAFCFRIADRVRSRPNQLGLEFSPARRLRDRIDIVGTLWIDTVARALVDVDFRYTGLDPRLEALNPGGRVTFRTMPNGLVLIDSWVIRMASFVPDTMHEARTRADSARGQRLISEAGGELAHATWPDGQSWHGSLGRLRLHAATATGRPASRIEVRLSDTHYQGRTDSLGDLEIADIIPGPYSLVVLDPRLSELNLELSTDVRFVAERDSTVHRDFRVPTPEDTTVARCLTDRRPARTESVLLLGRVLTPEGQPVRGVRITLRERALTALDIERASYTTGTDGLFEFCPPTLHKGMTLLLRASRGTWSAERVITIADKLTIVRMPFMPRP